MVVLLVFAHTNGDHPHIWGKPFRNADWDMYFEHEKMEPAGIINSAIPKIEGEPRLYEQKQAAPPLIG
jgi:hypothetical protein